MDWTGMDWNGTQTNPEVTGMGLKRTQNLLNCKQILKHLANVAIFYVSFQSLLVIYSISLNLKQKTRNTILVYRCLNMKYFLKLMMVGIR